jgi:SAM-dependent methyltransferase
MGTPMRKSWRVARAHDGPTELACTSAEVEAFWSRVAAHDYERANVRLSDSHTQRFDISVPRLRLPPRGRVLNLWSRQGEMLPMLRARFPDAEIVNLEISRVMVAQTKARFPDELVQECDLQSIAWPDGYFDAALSLEMLEHSPSPGRILREFRRVLKPGGQLVLTCPALVAELPLWVADRFLGNHGEGPHRFPTVRGVKHMLRAAGFVVAYHRATLFMPPELGAWSRPLDRLSERLFQWWPLWEFGLRQLYEAYRNDTSGCSSIATHADE